MWRGTPLEGAAAQLVLAVTALAWGSTAGGATLQVGPAAAYRSPCAAIAAAGPDDEVDVAPGTYTDSCEINVSGLVLKGVGGRPKIDLSGTDHPADYKGIYVIQADGVRIENLELTGAHIPIDVQHGGNGAGLRIQASGAVVHGCYIHDNQNGILAGPVTGDNTGTLTVEYTELARNGTGDACTVPGLSCTHNVYVGPFARFVFQYSWTHQVASDTPDKGHLLKSRAAETDLLYSRFSGEGGLDSYEIDLPNGGLGIVVGNVIQQGTQTGNSIILDYGEEGLARPDTRLFVVANTFVNDLGHGTFIQVATGAALTAHDNLFVGAGTPSSSGALPADNLSGVDPLFVDATAFDYHLDPGSPAIGRAVPPGSVGGASLVPEWEYVHPLQRAARATQRDAGAFEHEAVCPGATPDACGTGASAICTSLQTDPRNCGACGTACAAGRGCTGGSCGAGTDVRQGGGCGHGVPGGGQRGHAAAIVPLLAALGGLLPRLWRRERHPGSAPEPTDEASLRGGA